MSEKWAERLLIRFQTIYRDAFAKHVSTDELRRDWIEVWAMVLETMTAEQIKDALTECTLKVKWPPTPAEFRALVIAPPAYEQMFHDAAHCRWTSSVVYWASQRFGRHEMKTATWAKDGKRWTQIVDALMGEELPEIPQHIPLPKPTHSYNVESARAAIAAARDKLTKAPPPGAIDTRWAERILEGCANGEPFPTVAVQMACRAKGIDYTTIKHATPVKPDVLRPDPYPEEMHLSDAWEEGRE